MIGRVAPAMATGSGSFGGLSDYLLREGSYDGSEGREKPLHAFVGNCSSVANAATEMEATASLGRAKTTPVYHVILSWEDGENPTAEQAEESARVFLRELGLDEHQYLGSLQADGKGGKTHLHLMVNRVHPVTHKVWNKRAVGVDPQTGAERLMNDYERVDLAGRAVEDRMGFRPRDWTYGKGHEAGLSEGARKAGYHDRTRSFQERVRDDLAPLVKHALDGPMPSWNQIHALVREHTGGYYKVGRNGGVIAGVEAGEWAKASSHLGISHADLEKRLGAFVPDRHAGRLFEQRVTSAARDVEDLRRQGGAGWADVHAAFESRGLEYRTFGGGGRVYDLDSAEHLKASDVERGLRMGEMVKTFGDFESAGDVRQRAAAAQAVKTAEDLARGSSLLADPSALVEDLVAHDATFTVSKLQKAVHERVDDEQLRAQIVEKVTDTCVVLEDDDGKRRFTTRDVIEEEAQMRDALAQLANDNVESVTDFGTLREMDEAIAKTQAAYEKSSALYDALHDDEDAEVRAQREHELVVADDEMKLAQQTRDAYVYATEAGPRVRQVSGVPGAGKTYLIDKIADAYTKAGRDVRGTAVSWQAVNELNAATDFSSRSVAKELYEWSQDRDRLRSHDVLTWDEVSMAGAISGAKVAHEVARSGGMLLEYGDNKQLAAVERGDFMRATSEALQSAGFGTFDMQTTRRQLLDREDRFGESDWQRRAVEAMRAGDVRAGLDAFDRRGLVKIVATDAERRALAVADWKAAVAGGERDAVGATYKNVDVAKSNAEAHEAMRELGLLRGEDHVVRTGFGERAFAAGERVVVRQTVQQREKTAEGYRVRSRFDNGDVSTITKIDGDVLHLRRVRDGARIAMNLRGLDAQGERTNRVDYAYFGTSHRVQGATKDTMRSEGSRASNAASTLVDLSRGRKRQTLYVSQESVGGKTERETYARFTKIAAREVRKEMATDKNFRVLGIGAEVKRTRAKTAEQTKEFDRVPSRPSVSPERSREQQLEP